MTCNSCLKDIIARRSIDYDDGDGTRVVVVAAKHEVTTNQDTNTGSSKTNVRFLLSSVVL